MRAHLLLRASVSRASFHRRNALSPPTSVGVGAARCLHGAPSTLLAVLQSLSRSPRDPTLLAALDSTLAGAHLLDASAAVLVLRALSRCRKLSQAKSILSDLKRRETVPVPFLYSIVLQCLLPDDPLLDVERVWTEICGESSGLHSFGVSDFVVHLCRRDGEFSEIEQVYRRVSGSRHRLDYRAYAALIGAFCSKDSPGLARDVHREMEEKGFEADGLTYFALFHSFCSNGHVFEADSVLRCMVERGDFELDVLIYGNFLNALCKSNKMREAHKLFVKMAKKDCEIMNNSVIILKPGRRVIFQFRPSRMVSEAMAFKVYFQALCRSGYVDEAEKLLKEATRADDVHESCVYKSFVEALFQAGRVDDAVRFFESQSRKGYVYAKEVAVAVALGLFKVGRVDDGFGLLQEVVRGGFVPTASIWNHVVECYWKLGREDEAIGLFNAMREGSCGGCARPDSSTYAVMIHGFIRKGEITKAVSIQEEMLKQHITVSHELYSAIFRGLWTCGKIEEAHKYLNGLIENGILISYVRWESLFDSCSKRHGDDIF